MDKGLETLYNKLTNIFHNTNSSPSSSPPSNPPSEPESNPVLPISTFFDRLVPSSAISTIQSSSNDRRASSGRVARQATMKTISVNLTTMKESTPPSVPGMDDAEFRRRGKEMVDYIADYLLHIR